MNLFFLFHVGNSKMETIGSRHYSQPYMWALSTFPSNPFKCFFHWTSLIFWSALSWRLKGVPLWWYVEFLSVQLSPVHYSFCKCLTAFPTSVTPTHGGCRSRPMSPFSMLQPGNFPTSVSGAVVGLALSISHLWNYSLSSPNFQNLQSFFFPHMFCPVFFFQLFWMGRYIWSFLLHLVWKQKWFQVIFNFFKTYWIRVLSLH